MHMPLWIEGQIQKLIDSKKMVIFRSIGQSSPDVELQLHNIKMQLKDHFKVIKYSEKEMLWPNSITADAIIPFYKDLPYSWVADINSTSDITFCIQAATLRGPHCHFDDLERMTRGQQFRRLLLGPTNEDYEGIIRTDCPDYEGLLNTLSTSKIFMYSGTVPASYTLSVLEAMFIGVPTISITDRWYRSGFEQWVPPTLFEVPEWEPVISFDSPDEGNQLIRFLLDHPTVLHNQSVLTHEWATKHFGKEVIASQWVQFLENL
jgi:hypothetical protein